jgi:hypothetical protein
MPYAFSTQGSVAVVRWGEPLMEDLVPCMEDVRRVQQTVGTPYLVLVVPEGAPAPSSATRDEMIRLIPELATTCLSMHQVFEGSGFFIGFKRSVLTGMLLAAGKLTPASKRVAYSVNATIEEVAARLPREVHADLHAAYAKVTSRSASAA